MYKSEQKQIIWAHGAGVLAVATTSVVDKVAVETTGPVVSTEEAE